MDVEDVGFDSVAEDDEDKDDEDDEDDGSDGVDCRAYMAFSSAEWNGEAADCACSHCSAAATPSDHP